MTTTPLHGEIREPSEGDFTLQPGYVLERLLGGLTYPTNACVGPDGELYVLEGGFSYPYISLTARLMRVLPGGETEVIADDFEGPAIGLLWHDGAFLVTHRGILSRVSLNGKRTDLITGIPAAGDHHTNHLALIGDELFFGQGSATNAGFVGPDNLLMYGWLKSHPEFCDVPAFDITLTGVNLESRGPINPWSKNRTGAFSPLDHQSSPGEVIRGQRLANGVVYRCAPDGSELRVHAWGFRNPYSIAQSLDGRVFCLDQGADVRGSRPLRSLDTVWELKEGGWYGFPDFLGGESVPQLAHAQQWDGDARFVMASHPPREEPFAHIPEAHAAAVQMQFSTSDDFGFPGDAFVACFGSGAPLTTGGEFIRTPQGVRRFELETRTLHDFYVNKNTGVGGSGPERPVAVRFSPDGRELYVVDYGIFGAPVTGALWRITRA